MIAFHLSANTTDFMRGMEAAQRSLDSFTKTGEKTQEAAKQFTLEAPAAQFDSKSAQGAGKAVEDASASAAQGVQMQAAVISSALSSALAPLGAIESKMSEMSNRAGGAMVTLARRIDNVMKGDRVIKQVAKVNSALGAPFRLVNAAISELERRFNVLGPTTEAAFSVVKSKILQWRNWLDQAFRFDDLIGRWTRFVGQLRQAGQPFTERAAITGIQLMGSAILLMVGKAVPAILRLKVAFRQTLVQAPLAALGAWLKLRNFMSTFGDVARKGLDRLFKFSMAQPIASVQKFVTTLGGVAPVAGRAATAVKSFGSQLLVALGFFGLAYKAVEFFSSGLKGASTLNESINKTGVIFRASTAIVTASADEMAAKYGVVKASFLDAAGGFGQLLQGMGRMSNKAAAETSVQLSKLAADASSMFNVSFEEASGKISSALRGESMPISAFGIDIQEAAVKAEAARMGIGNLSGELTTAQKVAARTSILMRGLSVAQGDLANTAEAPANATREFQGRIANLATAIGTTFQPALEAALGAANEFARMLIGSFDSASGSWDGFVQAIVSGFETVGMVIRNFPAFLEIATLKFREFALNAVAYVATIPANLAILGNYIATNWYELIVDAINGVGAVFQNLGKNIGEFAFAVYQFLKDPTQGFQFDWTPLLDGFKATAAELPELIKPELVSMQEEIDAKLAQIATAEAARAKPKKPGLPRPAPLMPELGSEGKKGKKKEEGAAGAFRLGSQEAASAVAQYGNKGRDNAAKDTAKNTKETNKLLQRIENKLPPAQPRGQALVAREF